MEAREEVSRVRRLSDQELLAGLSGVLGSSRKLVALLVVHLGEVEERRLHLLAGHGSLFAYCTDRLGMSEDEAYRRIEVARLGRRFPALFEGLATGRVSLSVAALLKGHLTEVNHVALLDAVAGKTVKGAREVLAVWFPRPDVPASIRKLPERRAVTGSGRTHPAPLAAPLFEGAGGAPGEEKASSSGAAFVPVSTARVRPPGAGAHRARLATENPAGRSHIASSSTRNPTDDPMPALFRDTAAASSPVATHPCEPRCANTPVERADVHAGTRAALSVEQPAALASASAPSRENRASSQIEPLSPERYKVVFTADGDLKRKLDLALDLLRHAVPDGDLPTIIGRALELLLEKTLQRRFAKTARRESHSPAMAREPASTGIASSAAAPATERVATRVGNAKVGVINPPAARISRVAPTPANDCTSVTNPHSSAPHDADDPPYPLPSASMPEPACDAGPRQRRHLASHTRRAALERDGLRCTWVGPDGVRCESRAWLEHDHIMPRGLGGGDEPSNIRIRCRAHNRLAAEQAYGQPAIARIIARRRASKNAGV